MFALLTFDLLDVVIYFVVCWLLDTFWILLFACFVVWLLVCICVILDFVLLFAILIRLFFGLVRGVWVFAYDVLVLLFICVCGFLFSI